MFWQIAVPLQKVGELAVMDPKGYRKEGISLYFHSHTTSIVGGFLRQWPYPKESVF